MTPRWRFSPSYCTLAYPSTHMVHQRPGRWRFVYTTNALGHRGPEIPPAVDVARPAVVVLGDSYTFGAGVNDGEEYAAVLRDALHGAADVVNLGVGGWGLTQEIRRYYDVGAPFRPPVVVLQFSANDPEDDLNCTVTRIDNGRFTFHDTGDAVFSVKRFLSRSPLQRSQVYNLVRDTAYRFFASRKIAATRAATQPAPGTSAIPPEEVVHADLLAHFARDLRAHGARLVLVIVNGQLAGFPHIAETVRTLASKGDLEVYDAADWLSGMTDYASPEGHIWGARAHRVVGERLAAILEPLLLPGGGAGAATR